jgi:hypothetical protein
MHRGRAKNGTLNSVEHFPISPWVNRLSHGPDSYTVMLERLVAAQELQKELRTQDRRLLQNQAPDVCLASKILEGSERSG